MYESNIFLVFRGTGAELLRLNWFRFGTSDAQPRNAFDEVQAELFDTTNGATTLKNGVVANSGSATNLKNGAFVGYRALYFGKGAGAIDIRYYPSAPAGSTIEVRLDSPSGPKAGTALLSATTNRWAQSVAYLDSTVTGTHNVYLVFKGTAATNLCQVDMFTFIEKTNCRAAMPVPTALRNYSTPGAIGDAPSISASPLLSPMGARMRISALEDYTAEFFSASGILLYRTGGFGRSDLRLDRKELTGRCTIVRVRSGGKTVSFIAAITPR
jgi:hypothetical protein